MVLHSNKVDVNLKVVYNKIIMILTENVCLKYQWSLQFQHNIKRDQWKSMFCLSVKYTANRCINEFQNKIMRGALYLNVQLKRYKPNLVMSRL